jgi:hypothetical protein
MRWSDLPINPPPRTLRQFAGLWLAVFSGLALWQGLVHDRIPTALALGGLGLGFGVPGVLWPAFIRPVFVGALVVTFPIGFIVSQTLLAILFYGIFTPLGVVFRLVGRDPLQRSRSSGQESYWAPKPMTGDVRGYFNQF